MKPKVSLIIPVFNTENYLEKCLLSAINQTFKEIEIIVVDDGSTDSSLKILKKYAKIDDRIKLFIQKNSGQGSARNLAMKEAVGEYIFNMDSDDWIDLNLLDKLYKCLLKNNSDLVLCGWHRVDEISKDSLKTITNIDVIDKLDKESIIRYVFSAKIKLMPWGCLIKKTIIDKYNITYPNLLHEDLYFMTRVFFYANKISIVKEKLYYWLARSSSTTNAFSMRHALGLGGMFSDWKDFLLKNKSFQVYKKEYIKGVVIYGQLALYRTMHLAKENEKENILVYLSTVILNISELEEYKMILSEKEINTSNLFLIFYEQLLLEISNDRKIKNNTYYVIALKAEIMQREITIKNRENTIKSKDEAIKNRENTIKSKDEAIKNKNKKIKDILIYKQKFIKIPIIKHPIKKYNAYKNLLERIK